MTSDDEPSYRRAVLASRSRIRPWNPVNPDDLAYHLRVQSTEHRSFLVRALDIDPAAEHDVVGKVNVTGVVRGRAHSGAMGYDAYDPYAGRGLFAEGLRLVIDIALAPEPHGMGLHRVEAAVQPGNVRSAGLLRSIGLRRRGAWPEYLWLADAHGAHAWRDHVVYGVTATEWPAAAYSDAGRPRPVVVVTAGGEQVGPPDVRAARALAIELGTPVLRSDSRPWPERLEDAVTGAVVLLPGDAAEIPARDAHRVVSATALTDAAAVTRVALDAQQAAHG